MTGIRFQIAHRFEQRWNRLADGARSDNLTDRLCQIALTAAVPFYRAGQWFHRAAYRWDLVERHRLSTPIICIGNLSLGGTGKTPVVEWLARKLKKEKINPVIVSRGYGGRIESMKTIRALVAGDGHSLLFPSEIVGDEPAELTTALEGVPVIVGPRRVDAARLAVDRFHPDVILLDDGFQHYALERDCNIVVMDSTRLPPGLRLFPRGTLREGLGALRRTQGLILTRCNPEGDSERASFIQRIRRKHPFLRIGETFLDVQGLSSPNGDITIAPTLLTGKSVFLFCGVGNPKSVEASLERLGMTIVQSILLPDHKTVSISILDEFRRQANDLGADFLVCTRKDGVKIPQNAWDHPTLPLLIPVVELKFLDPFQETHILNLIKSKVKSHESVSSPSVV